jgi:trimeric autotransporter adhesin
MRIGMNAALLVVFGTILLGAGAASQAVWAQGAQHKMSPPPASPKATVEPTGAWQPKSTAYIKASNTSKYQLFASAIALSANGNTLAVGNPYEESAAKGINGNQADHSALHSGAVYVYTRIAGAWKQQAYIKASNAHARYQFGNSVSLSANGNTLAVGSLGESSSAKGINGNQADDSMDSAGAVYVFTRSGGAWSQQAYLKSSNTSAADVDYQFGYAVALSSDGITLAASEINDPSNAAGINGDDKNTAAPEAGAVFVFTRSSSGWSQQAYVKPWNTTAGAAIFGYAVALSGNGDMLAVGSQNEDGGRGAVYAYARSGGAWSQQTRLRASNIERDDQFGCSVGISDDGNTILAGSCEEDAMLAGIQPPSAGANDRGDDASAGAAYIFVHADGRWSQQAYMKAFNTRINDQFGWALAISGDGNTAAIGSHLEDSGAKGIDGDEKDFSSEDSGAVYVYTRKGTEWSPAAYVKAPNTKPSAEFGIAVALNGDGKMLAVGATTENSGAKAVNGNQADISAPEAGAAYVYY